MEDEKLIVHDEFINESANNCNNQGTSLESIVSKYITILTGIHNEAITEGAIADSILAFISAAQKLGTQLSETSAYINTDLTTYVSDIDTADSYVF